MKDKSCPGLPQQLHDIMMDMSYTCPHNIKSEHWDLGNYVVSLYAYHCNKCIILAVGRGLVGVLKDGEGYAVGGNRVFGNHIPSYCESKNSSSCKSHLKKTQTSLTYIFC